MVLLCKSGCFGAREVLPADAANLPPIVRSRRRRKETDVDAPSPSRRRIEAILKTSRERAEEKRQEKLDLVREQVESGSLVIRKMTKDERRKYPPKPDQPKGPAKR